MCLYTLWQKPKIADKDIKVFKVLQNRDGRLLSPYYGAEYIPGKVKWVKRFKLEDRLLVESKFINSYTPTERIGMRVVHNGLHSYARKPQILYSYEAVIPKGSSYYLSDCGGEYVSLKLKVL